jgi:hypothetical protein
VVVDVHAAAESRQCYCWLALTSIRNLLSCIDKDIDDVPASGPAPVMIRLEEWLIIGADYERLTYEMELAPEIVAQLGEGGSL